MAIVGILIMTNLGQEVIGGIVGGITVIIVSGICLWLFQRFRRFEIRFLDANMPVTAEHMEKSIAIGLPVGSSTINMSLRPRTGVELRLVNFAFFDNPVYPKRLLPVSVGRRRSVSDIKVASFSRLDNDAKWVDIPLLPRSKESFTAEVNQDFYEHSRIVFRLVFNVADQMNAWDGIFGIQLRYQESGSLGLRNVYSKVFIAGQNTRRPISFALRGVQRSMPVKGD